MSDANIYDLNISELSQKIKTRELSCLEVLDCFLKRTERLNPTLNALQVYAEQAITHAKILDDELAKGNYRGPLHGIPTTVKQSIDVAGQATTMGVKTLADNIVQQDAPAVERLRKAGANIFARGNCAEFCMRWHTEGSHQGATVNPWDASLTSGGSSGGDAVAIATKMTPLALGEDSGGSLRIPAQCNGAYALKPTQGLIPNASVDTLQQGLPVVAQLFSVVGPMAHSISGLHTALTLLEGADSRDPRTVDTKPRAFQQSSVALHKPNGMAADIADALDDAAEILQANGIKVVAAEPPEVERCGDIWNQLIFSEVALRIYPHIEQMLSSDQRTHLQSNFALHPVLSLADYQQALQDRYRLACVWAEFFKQYQFILGPIMPQPAFKLGLDVNLTAGFRELSANMSFLNVANVLGLPAVALPIKVISNLPQVIQVVGPSFSDAACLELAALIEQGVAYSAAEHFPE